MVSIRSSDFTNDSVFSIVEPTKESKGQCNRAVFSPPFSGRAPPDTRGDRSKSYLPLLGDLPFHLSIFAGCGHRPASALRSTARYLDIGPAAKAPAEMQVLFAAPGMEPSGSLMERMRFSRFTKGTDWGKIETERKRKRDPAGTSFFSR